jgi:hypothetical protein
MQAKLQRFLSSKDKTAEFKQLPGWLIKRITPRLDRIKGAQIFADAINAGGYDKLTVPQKYRYKTAGAEVAIAQKVKGSGEKLNLTETQQIFALAKDLRWNDVHSNNYVKIAPNKVAITDTDMRWIDKAYNPDKTAEKILDIMLSYKEDGFLKSSPFDKEAEQFLKDQKDIYSARAGE